MPLAAACFEGSHQPLADTLTAAGAITQPTGDRTGQAANDFHFESLGRRAPYMDRLAEK
jgi:hypothetical protein